jgi:D-amino peptidase
MVGMHAMAGTPDGVLSHTVSGQAWQNLRFNGTLVGETGINAALCGHWGCPVLLVTGDRAVCREGRELLGDGLTTVEVKVGLGRFSARNVPAVRAREMIEDGAKRALKDLKAVQPYDPGSPCEIEIEFTSPDRLEEYRNRKNVEVTGARSIVARGDDWWQAWSSFYF